jgi:hypothetical protein
LLDDGSMSRRADPSKPSRSRRSGVVALIMATLAPTLSAQGTGSIRVGVDHRINEVEGRSPDRCPSATRAEVRIVSSPSVAGVYVDGAPVGVVDDFDGVFQSLSITPGRHEIVLYLEGFRTARHGVFVTPGSTLTIRPMMTLVETGETSELPASRELQSRDERARLEPPLVGRLAVLVKPGSAVVSLDGELSSVSSEGRFDFDLPAGSHMVTASAPGHEVFAHRLTITQGATTLLRVRLARLKRK